MGVRIFGDDDEHAPHHLRRTAAIANLETSARAMAPLSPAAAIWACTSGSFIDGLDHARRQADALASLLDCPATSTSLAFRAALDALGLRRVAVLATYPEETTAAFQRFLEEAGITVAGVHCLDAPSGPAAALLGESAFIEHAAAMDIGPGTALLIPDTAVPTLAWIAPLEQRLGCTVLSANQVSLWHTARLGGIRASLPDLGRLWASTAVHAP
jgi:maleate cis-trans isomerase